MLYFLYGQDTYRLTQKVREIEKQYAEVHGNALNLQKIDAGCIGFKEFRDSFSQQSLFIRKKLFILEDVFSNPEFKESLLKAAKELAKSEAVVVIAEKSQPKETDKLFIALQESSQSQQFALLRGRDLVEWAKKQLRNYGAKADELTIRKLITYCKSDTWALANELKKLAAFSKEIKPEYIDLFLRLSLESEIFSTIDCLAQGSKKKALQLLESHFKKGDSPFYLLKMIAYQFRNLILVKSCGADYACRQRLGLHPFVLRKTSQLASRFSFEELKKVFHRVFETDCKIKQGKVSPEQGLRELIAML